MLISNKLHSFRNFSAQSYTIILTVLAQKLVKSLVQGKIALVTPAVATLHPAAPATAMH